MPSRSRGFRAVRGLRPLFARRPDSTELAGSAVGVGKANAKLILFGEHVVLYGRPAISMPVPSLAVTASARRWDGPVVVESTLFDTGWREMVTAPKSNLGGSAVSRVAVTAITRHLGVADSGLFVTVDSAIPPGRGFGSSAASSASIIESIASLHGCELSDDERYALIQESEALAHGKASGVDARTVIATGGMIWFRNGTARPLSVARGRPPALVVADTGVSGSTRRAVATVRRYVSANRASAEAMMDRIAGLTVDAATDLGMGRHGELGRRMTEAQEMLATFGVSCPQIDRLVDAAITGGALGAKLSGGGLGGCVIALAQDAAAAHTVIEHMRTAGATDVVAISLNPVPTWT